MTSSLDELRRWIGATEQRGDDVSAAPLAALSATLDRDDPAPLPGSDVPPLWHWLFFNGAARQSELGPDGHPRRGGFLPPVDLPRRMWAGGRLQFNHPLQVGDEVLRRSRIADVSGKRGRSGELVFVGVHHEISNARGVALTEEHDIVYRSAPQPGAAAAAPVMAPRDEQFSREIVPDPVLLFRYSALTFNGHRIHYDLDYARDVEGYPGLIVHGPLIATLLLDLARRQMPQLAVRRFEFKALHPWFHIHPFTLCGRTDAGGRIALWARDHAGVLAMQAVAEAR
jgi:3-methylfumaryl-CoA hydratase